MLVAKAIAVDHPPTGEDCSAPVSRVRDADAAARGADTPEHASEAGLTALDLTVIALSHPDPVSSVKPRSRLFGALFRSRSGLALANPRLEALRRYVVLFRLDGSPSDEAGRALRDAGYASRQIEEIDRHIMPPNGREAAGNGRAR